MTTQADLEQWWLRLDEDQQQRWLRYSTGDTVPPDLYPSLRGTFVARVSDADPPAVASTRVEPRVGHFLAAKRNTLLRSTSPGRALPQPRSAGDDAESAALPGYAAASASGSTNG